MEALALGLALMLPVLLGGFWLNAFVPADTPARWASVWGAGAVLGLLVLPQLMSAQDALGYALSFSPIVTAVVILSAVALIIRLTVKRASAGAAAPDAPITRLEYALLAALCGLILLRLGGLAVEVYWRPLYPWDATMHWATKARVWFDHKAMVPFVDNQTWLELGGKGVYTDRHPDYPETIPLLQVWMNLALDRWDESLMNLPWLLCLAGLGGMFYGQLRIAGVAVPLACASTYLLLSMPLINTHVALAGYADLFLGAAFAGSVLSLHNWVHTRQSWLAALSLIFALFCPLIKNEGFIWALTLVPAVAVALMQRRQAAKFFVLMLMCVAFLILVLPEDWEVAGHTTEDIRPEFNMSALAGIVYSVLVHDNGHLFGYLVMLLIPLGIVMPGAMTRTYLGITATLATAVGAYFFLFVFTGFGVGAEDFAAVGRLSLHLIPALLFLCTLLYHELLQREYFWLPEKAD